jgi:hypothetical protein
LNAKTMFTPLSDDEIAAAEAAPKTDAKQPIVPVPDDAPEMLFRHPKLGAPTKAWPYHDAEGRLIGYVARFDYQDDKDAAAKDYLPITYCRIGKDRFAWRAKGIPDPRPLYNLPGILSRPDATVIVAEGEKAADAAAILFPEMVATTPPHGAKSPHKADWTTLSGRKLVIATDNDDAGQAFGDRVCELARAAGAASVLHLHPDRLGAWVWAGGTRELRDGPVPKGWDIADALADGWTSEAVAELHSDPAFLPPYMDPEDRETLRRREAGEPEELARWPFRVVRNGVEKRIERTDKDTGIITTEWKWFCSLIEVLAETRSTAGEEWGRLLQVTDRDNRSKEWAMPMSMLAGDGIAYRERLLSLGLIIANGRFAKEALHEYISTARPGNKARCVTRLGWGGSGFACPRSTHEDDPNA